MPEDESYLNKRGLSHFWDNIDTLKQDKLTAGANITIAADNTISASQPTVNNATLTIQKEGTSVGTFTANASSNSTVNIIETDPTVPAWAKASSKPTYTWTEIANRPTNVSAFTNDAGYLTSVPTATTNSLGVVQVGSGLAISSGGVLSATGGGTADDVAWGHITGTMADQTDLANALAAKADSSSLAAVATSGSYNDLTDTPTIPAAQIQSDWAQADNTKLDYIKNKPSLATVATSGNYNDLSNKPTIPTVNNATLTIQKNGTSAGTFTANASSNKTINITVPTTAADVSALPASTKYGASIAVSINTTDYKVTTTLKDQDGNTLGTAQVIDLPLESVVVNGSYDSTNKKIVLTLQNGNTIDIPVADLVAGLQSEITSSNMLSSDLVDDTNHTHKFVTAAQITKLNGIATGAEVNQNAFSNVKVGSTTVAADTKTDTLELVAGSNVTLTPDATNDKVTIAATDTTYNDATTSASGLMSASDKTKLNGIASGAEVNVQSDWNQTTTTADDYIKNKPTIPTVNNATLTITQNGTSAGTFTANASSNKTIALTDTTYSDATTSASGLMSASDKTKLNGIASGAEVNVQSDWNQTTTTADDYIKNKPTLATVATSGSYNDLSNKPTIPTVNNATLTIQKNGTNVQTFTANQSTNATANITVPTNTNELTNGAGFITSSGTAAKANQLTTARTIAIGTGATGTATSFNGTSNITIPITDVKDAYVTWGGKNIAGNVTPDDMGCIDEFGHNKLAFLSADCIEVKYSTDGGSSWVDYGLTDAQKVKMVSTTGTGMYVGGSTDNATSSNITNLKLRVRIAAGPTSGGKIYTAAKKILINMSTQGASGSKVDIRYRTIANYKAGTETWVNVGTFDLAGGSGWNSIPFNYTFGGSFSTQTSQMGQIEFVLYCTGLGTWGLKKPDFIDFRLIGSTNWTMPSEMARAGHLYTVDENQNATFPANVSVTGSLKHGNYTYTLPNKNGTVAMTSDIPSVPTVNNGQLTIQKNGTNVATFTANQSGNATANITVPTKTSDLTNDSGFVNATAIAGKQDLLTAGAHINITGTTIKAVDYVHSEQPVATSSVTPVVTGSMISNGTITADKLATGATLKLTLSTSDIGEGAALAANTLYGVYQ